MERITLTKDFQKEIFCELLRKYSRDELSKIIGVNSSSIYFIKNYKIRSIDIKKFNRIALILSLKKSDIEKNTIRIFSDKELLKGLETGRKIRHKQLKTWKSELPKINNIMENNSLNVELWFEKYVKLTNFGARKVLKIEKNKDTIVVFLRTHSNVTKYKKTFKVVLPKSIALDNDFSYFFGLWCGDRTGGGRIGVINTSHELILAAKNYLKKMYQDPKYYVLRSSKIENIPPLPIKVDKVYVVKNMAGTYVPFIFSTNGYFKTFFDFLHENLDEFLLHIQHKNAFFAGLFDAEGNVSLEDSCFRWACKNKINIEIYKKHLTSMGLFKRYDGSSLVTYNKNYFIKNIFPYIKHKQKINRINLLFFDKGYLEDRFKKLLICINDSPGKELKEIAHIAKKKKVYAQCKFLCKKGYIKTEGYPMKLYVTKKGLNEIGREGQ